MVQLAIMLGGRDFASPGYCTLLALLRTACHSPMPYLWPKASLTLFISILSSIHVPLFPLAAHLWLIPPLFPPFHHIFVHWHGIANCNVSNSVIFFAPNSKNSLQGVQGFSFVTHHKSRTIAEVCLVYIVVLKRVSLWLGRASGGIIQESSGLPHTSHSSAAMLLTCSQQDLPSISSQQGEQQWQLQAACSLRTIGKHWPCTATLCSLT